MVANKAMAEGKMNEAFSGELDKATDLMASEGFTINAPKQPTTNVLAKGSPAAKRSPAKAGWDAVAKGFTEAMKSEEVKTAATTSAIDAAAQLTANALMPKKKTREGGDFSGFSRLRFGRS